MSRKLKRAVVSGGVVYPAGATPPDEVAETITADVWEQGGKSSPRPEASESEEKAKPSRRKPKAD